MKILSKISFAALIGVLFIYTSCTKSLVTPATTTTSANTLSVSKQIAMSLYKSISGSYGTANIGNGIKAPNNINISKSGLRVNGTDPYCGLTIDTTLYLNNLVVDTTKLVYSHYKFTYTCSSSFLDGYILSDSITYTDKGTHFFNKYITGQNYTVNKSNTDNNVVSMHGSIGVSYHISTLNDAQTITAYNNADTQYALNNLSVNIATGTADVTSGTASFNAHITYMDPTTVATGVSGTFTGSVTFLGGHLAKITIHTTSGTTDVYTMNLLNGETL